MKLKIKFNYLDNSIESDDFQQGILDVYYQEIENIYYHRFIGQIPSNKSSDVCSFLESNLDSEIDVVFIDRYENEIDRLLDGKVININKDIFNNICRIEIKAQITI